MNKYTPQFWDLPASKRGWCREFVEMKFELVLMCLNSMEVLICLNSVDSIPAHEVSSLRKFSARPRLRAEKWLSATQERGNTEIHNFKVSGEVAPTICAVTRDSPGTWTRHRNSSAGGASVWPVWKQLYKQWGEDLHLGRGGVVSAISTSGVHHRLQGWFYNAGCIRKRMWFTSDRQTSVSEVTAGESIDDTLLKVLELDLNGPGTDSDVPQGQLSINATQVDSEEEPLMGFAVTQ